MTAALAYFVKYEGTFGGNAREAGQVALLGMAMIFGVLAVLWGVIELLHVLLGRPKKAPEPDPLPKASPAEEAEQEPKEDEGAVIAAITAAIAAARSEEGNSSAFRVVQFRRSSRGNANR